ncbi:MAG: PGPGW domain-containing protein [Brevibacterium sp.]|uniref:PGPGW domain-containing protein n=1 Tax=Brevibacterium sp. TaxID=1701 RepID=UPI00264A304D|nr:PGPGW domain-containing protein [Brevibacterium sp.]MDN5807678.1 PGPGW domain-containing protein [Brevibacterium sp.]MDN5832901.1 PGPGW domain-containing protein [Brevibacterium sp.]MDN5877667.1 PGPGW domain-containing protein [Brevibacterium sp.]MDN5908442.1 PGPGW domain-containing protein [Brevibacterium sp.]MDN6123735.1 PGPGW domain-containing protein [Brevibacterium sp.]
MNNDPHDKRPRGWLSRHHKQGVRPWRKTRLSFLRWRGTVTSNPHTARLYRFVVGGVGTLIVIIGLLAVPLPGPGWLTVIIGLFVISSEFRWAQRILHFVRVNVEKWTHWVIAQPLWMRWTMAAVTAACVAVLVWAAFKIIGLPDWVPELEVLKLLELQ